MQNININDYVNPDNIYMETGTTADGKKKGIPLSKYLKKISKDVYSSEEIKTNKVWVDGKPIYRKVICWNVASGTQWIGLKFVDIGIANYDYIYFADGTRFVESNEYVKEISNGENIYISTKQNELTTKQITTTRAYTFVLEYTKTTD